MNYENREYLIFNSSDVGMVDFNEILETSVETLRYSIDKTRTFIKWEGETAPTFTESLTGVSGPYTHSEILDIVSTEEWVKVEPDVEE
jgi:hypothetical protein